jgi:hypothetical protein
MGATWGARRVIYLLLPELRIAHPPACATQLMIT